jgi:hypothetical protein
MTTVVKRTVRSSPFRDANETWSSIIELLTRGKDSDARQALRAVAGLACCIITDQALKDAPLITTCDGPRTRIYCLYDEDSIDSTSANEDKLGFDPLKGDWHLSLPCVAGELDWVQAALKKHGDRITARDLTSGINEGRAAFVKSMALTLDVEQFLKS